MEAVMSKKLQKFTHNYVLNPETKGNAEKSAIESGYSPKYARGNAHKLVAKGCKLIEKLEQEERDRLRNSKDDKLLLLAEQIDFFKSVLPDKQALYKDNEKPSLLTEIKGIINTLKGLIREHGELSGDYTTKVETTNETKLNLTPEKSRELQSQINRLFNKVEEN